LLRNHRQNRGFEKNRPGPSVSDRYQSCFLFSTGSRALRTALRAPRYFRFLRPRAPLELNTCFLQSRFVHAYIACNAFVKYCRHISTMHSLRLAFVLTLLAIVVSSAPLDSAYPRLCPNLSLNLDVHPLQAAMRHRAPRTQVPDPPPADALSLFLIRSFC
jgi:hypothetical protein